MLKEISDGRITESGTYRQLVSSAEMNCPYIPMTHGKQVNKEGSRFRALMAAQLNAASVDIPQARTDHVPALGQPSSGDSKRESLAV